MIDGFCQELALGGKGRPLGLSIFPSEWERGGRKRGSAALPSSPHPRSTPRGLSEDSQDRKEPLNQKWGHGSGWGSGLLQARPLSSPPAPRDRDRDRRGKCSAALPLLLLQLLFGHHLLVLVSPQLPRAVFKGEDLSPCREEMASEAAGGSEC